MRETFLDTADQILRFKSHREPVVRKMVITMIPALAAYDTQTFTEHFLHKAMGHLLTQLEKPNERSFGETIFIWPMKFLTPFSQPSLPLAIPLPLLGVT